MSMTLICCHVNGYIVAITSFSPCQSGKQPAQYQTDNKVICSIIERGTQANQSFKIDESVCWQVIKIALNLFELC